jgi:hypothetical protein
MSDDQFGGIDPPAEQIPVKWIEVRGREEHEAILKDPEKMKSLGLDPYFETVAYLRSWDGGWLKDEV